MCGAIMAQAGAPAVSSPTATSSQHPSAQEIGHDHQPAHGQEMGHDHHRHERAPLPKNVINSIAIPDVLMTDQDGRKVRLYSDLMKDKLVLINFFYTTCEGVCSTSGYWLSKLQDKLGRRLDKEIIILSISIDPQKDTPDKLKKWSTLWKRKSGWTLVASEDKALRDMMLNFSPYPSPGTHTTVVFLGNGAQNPVGWTAFDIIDEGLLLLDYFEKTKSK